MENTHDTDLYNLKSGTNIIRAIKSKIMRRAEYVVRMGEMRNSYRILVRAETVWRTLINGRTV